MQIGYADHDITPAPGEEMTGYGFYLNRRATGTLDSLHARALAFRDGDASVLLIQLDLIGLDAEHVEELRQRLASAHGLARDAVMFHCTHTHTGPSSMSFIGVGQITQALRGTLTRQICEAAADALSSLGPLGSAAWFDEDFAGIGFNRDDPGGAVDPRVRGLLLTPETGAPVVLVNYACHPVALGVKAQYSADYPGAVATQLAASGLRCLFFTGPSGDIDPLVNRAQWASGTAESLHIYGRRIAAVVEDALPRAGEVQLSPPRVASQMIDLGVDASAAEELKSVAEQARQTLAGDPSDGRARATLNAAMYLLGRLDAEGDVKTEPVEVQTLSFGKVTLAAVSAELFTELGQIIRRESGLARLLLAATSNGLAGYIATRDSIERKSYAARSAYFYKRFPQRPGAGEEFARDAGQFLARTSRAAS